jgi:hypothetical protein
VKWLHQLVGNVYRVPGALLRIGDVKDGPVHVRRLEEQGFGSAQPEDDQELDDESRLIARRRWRGERAQLLRLRQGELRLTGVLVLEQLEALGGVGTTMLLLDRPRTGYHHLAQLLVQPGSRVHAGQPIAIMGGSPAPGSSISAPVFIGLVHLHFDLMLGGQLDGNGRLREGGYCDPAPVLPVLQHLALKNAWGPVARVEG